MSQKTLRLLVVIEGDDATGYSAYVPDLSGCVGAARTREEIEQLMRDSIVFHLEGMLLAGQPLPEPVSEAIVVDAPVPDLATIA